MRAISTLVVFFVTPLVHATFLQLSSTTLPARSASSQNRLRFVNNGTRVVQIGDRETSRIYDLNDLSTYLLATGLPTAYPESPFFERHQTEEIFYIGDQRQDDSGYTIRRYLKGFSLANRDVQGTYVATLTKGSAYAADMPMLELSQDESTLYMSKSSGGEISALNLNTYSVEANYQIPGVLQRGLKSLREIMYNGTKVLVAETKDTKYLSTLQFFDPIANKTIFTLTAESLKLGTGGNYYSLRNTEFSKNHEQAILCGRPKCVVYDLTKQSIATELQVEGTLGSAAKFSPDGRFIFILDSRVSPTLFSVVDAASGAVTSPPVPVRTGAYIKFFQSSDKESYVILLRDRLLQLSAKDGKTIHQYIVTNTNESFEDLAYLSQDDFEIRLVTSKNTGEINTWSLSN